MSLVHISVILLLYKFASISPSNDHGWYSFRIILIAASGSTEHPIRNHKTGRGTDLLGLEVAEEGLGGGRFPQRLLQPRTLPFLDGFEHAQAAAEFHHVGSSPAPQNLYIKS
jgi:hypothetical protein